MKLIAIGDPHIHTDNIIIFNMFMEKLFSLIKNETPDVIVILGDVLHTHERLHTIAFNKACEFIRGILKVKNESTKIYVLVGNHDMISEREFLNTNHWMNCMKKWDDNLYIVDKVINHNIQGVNCVFCPYVSAGRFKEALSTLENEISFFDIVFAHQEFKGCKMGAIISENGDIWPENYPQVISGHIHSKQTPQSNIYYPGSALQHAFGENEDNIIALINISKEEDIIYKKEEIDLGLPRKKIIYTNVENIDNDIDNLNKTNIDKLKVSISGSYEEFKAFKKTSKYKNLIKKGFKIIFKPNNILDVKEEEKHRNVDFETILKHLITQQKNSHLTEAYELIVNNKEISNKDIIYIE